MKLAIAAFTGRGAELANRLAGALTDAGSPPPEVAVFGRAGDSGRSLRDWTERAFSHAGGIVFVGACGIAVRAIAHFVRDKLTDPAVVAVDERGKYAVALLSGHAGGANALAARVADAAGGTPVVSTATDLAGIFAVDVWAAERSLHLGERALAKEVSAALLAGETVGFACDFPVAGVLPEGLADGPAALGICVTLDAAKEPFPRTLHAFPRIVTVGAGCRRGISAEMFEREILGALGDARIPLAAVRQLATIDRKAEEPCILAFCERYGLPLAAASAEVLSALEGEFTPSEFVRGTVGVDNVCERAALYASREGRVIMKKHAAGGVTAAAAADRWTCGFGEETG